ncbi:MAG: hypothetical protein KGJ56_02820 [Gammaproteobacteria bacterium]|nr:hypothetical protein [Gammaproteobacteria bacterium]
MNRTTLTTVKTPHARARILEARISPVISWGGADESLCGKCATVLVRAPLDAVREKFRNEAQLLIKCPQCGTYNAVPSQPGR